MGDIDNYTREALAVIRHLSEAIGGRGSCTPQEQQAAEFMADKLRDAGVQGAHTEAIKGVVSTYRPFILAFSSALLGVIVALTFGNRLALAVAALLSLLGAWGMLAETDLSANWMQWILPKSRGHNTVGVIPATGQAQRKVVLSAHLDTHRTPVFYSSKTWHKVFNLLVSAALLSMIVGAFAFCLGVIFNWTWMRWVGLIIAPMQIFALSMCVHADFTPFSPGANDDASGVGVIFGLAKRLQEESLKNTEVWIAYKDCEEVGCYGMAGFLDAHAEELGREAIYLVLDEVGQGRIKYIRLDGIVVKRPTHPRALELAKKVSAGMPELGVVERVGVAYTDAQVATKRGLIALTISCDIPPETSRVSHWHQMSDRVEHIDPRILADAHAFTWGLLQEIDRI